MLSKDALNRLMISTASKDAGNEVASAINLAEALAKTSTYLLVNAIKATATSQTTDFGSLLVGDRVAMIKATAGNADFIEPSVAGDLGQAAVVGDLYLVFRPVATVLAAAVAAAKTAGTF